MIGMGTKKTAKMGHHKKSAQNTSGTPVGSYPSGRTIKPSFGQISGLARGYSVFNAAGEEIAVGLGMWDAIAFAMSEKEA